MSTVIIFPGQGAQFIGMGKDLFSNYPNIVKEANEILGYDIVDLCTNKANKSKLDFTQYTQPALFVVNALSYYKYCEQNAQPSYAIGHSLGEYNALHAAGVFDFATGLKLVKKRGELFGRIKDGGMVAVLGSTAKSIQPFLEDKEIQLANYNSDSQLIVSGKTSDLQLFVKELQALDIKVIPLNVSGAFHSSLMAKARDIFDLYIEDVQFSKPKLPVSSNYAVKEYSVHNTKEFLVNQITGSVLWKDQIEKLLGLGFNSFTELGESKILTKLVDTIKKDFKANQASNSNTKRLLGAKTFLDRYNVNLAYVIGGMYKAISSVNLVVKASKVNILSFYGTGGVSLSEIENAIKLIKLSLQNKETFGVNFLANPLQEDQELELAMLCVKEQVRVIEASAFTKVSLALVYYRLKGISKDDSGRLIASNKIMVKLSHPEVAKEFLSPPNEIYVKKLLNLGLISETEAALASKFSMADDITLEADSGGHTDQKTPFVLVPEIILLRNEHIKKYNFDSKIHVGAAGGIGTPESVLAAFMLGADYVVTGSINQCTVESGTSSEVKEILSQVGIHDTAIAPAGDMFELGAKVQVVKKGTLFSTRANRLYELYKQNSNLESILEKDRSLIETSYFKRPLNEVVIEVTDYIRAKKPNELKRFEENPKMKMAQVFKWYFAQSTKFAIQGEIDRKLDFQVQCGPAMGAFNHWVKNTDIENWKSRNVDTIGLRIMNEAENLLKNRINQLKQIND